MDFRTFKIGFVVRDKKRVYEYWDEIFASQKWAEGKFTRLFEEKWEKWNDLPAVATSSWAGAAMACLEYFKVRGKKVLCPTNTFMATPLSVVKAGGTVVFGDCNRDDLCLSYDAVVSAAAQHDLAAVWPRAHRRAHCLRHASHRGVLPVQRHRPPGGLRACPWGFLEREETGNLGRCRRLFILCHQINQYRRRGDACF